MTTARHYSPRLDRTAKCSSPNNCKYGTPADAHIDSESISAEEYIDYIKEQRTRHNIETTAPIEVYYSGLPKETAEKVFQLETERIKEYDSFGTLSTHDVENNQTEENKNRLKELNQSIESSDDTISKIDSLLGGSSVNEAQKQTLLELKKAEERQKEENLKKRDFFENNPLDHQTYDEQQEEENDQSASAAWEKISNSEPSAAKRYYGKTPNIQVGSNTPWGKADNVEYPADGIAVVGTPSHGGIKLSPERNKYIPKELRNKNGWYEEDTESSIIGWKYPEAFPHYVNGTHKGDTNSAVRDFEGSVKDWFPDEYEQATGKEVSPEESYMRREQLKAAESEAFRKKHPQKFLADKGGSKWDSRPEVKSVLPEGYSVVTATKASTGEARHYAVPKHEAYPVRDNGKFGTYNENLVIDDRRHTDITAVVESTKNQLEDEDHRSNTPVTRGEELRYDTSGLSAKQAEKADAELSKRYRYRDNNGNETIETKIEHMQRLGVQGKQRMHDGTSEKYYANLANSSTVERLSKAEFEALDQPETTKESTRLSIEATKANKSVERAEKKVSEAWSSEEYQKAKSSLEKAQRKADEAEKRYRESFDRDRADYQEKSNLAKSAAETTWKGGIAQDFEAKKHRNHSLYSSTREDVANYVNDYQSRNGYPPTETEVKYRVELFAEQKKNQFSDDEERTNFKKRSAQDFLTEFPTWAPLGQRVE